MHAFKYGSFKPDSRFLRQVILWAEASYFFLQGCSSHFRTSGLLRILQLLLHALNCVSKSKCEMWLGSSRFLDSYTKRWLKRIVQGVSLHENDLSLISIVRVIDSFLTGVALLGWESAPLVSCLNANAGRFMLCFCERFTVGESSENELSRKAMVFMLLAGAALMIADKPVTKQQGERSYNIQRIAWALASLLPDFFFQPHSFSKFIHTYYHWYFGSSKQSRCLIFEVCRMKIEDICQCYPRPKSMIPLPGNTLKPSFGTVGGANKTATGYDSTLVEIIHTAAVYCRLLGKQQPAGFLDRYAHAATDLSQENVRDFDD